MKTDLLDLVVVSIPSGTSTSSIGLHAVQMSNWLKDHGLVWGKDYDWHINRTRNETTFRFHNTATAYASFFSLRWVNNEVH
jgi:hypothetical protein